MTSMLDPEVKPSTAKEMVHKSKGCLAVLLAVAVLAFGGIFVYQQGKDLLAGFGETPDFPGPGKAAVTITVPEGASVESIGRILVEEKVVASTKAWEEAVASEDRSTSIQSGRYQMKQEMPAIEALRLLINPGASRVRSQFTVPEGLRLSRQIDTLVKGTKIPKTEFDKVAKNPKNLGLPKYAGKNVEGVLFPNTYELVADATAESTMKQMVDQYKKVTGDIDIDARAKALGVKPYDILIVASIIEREVNKDEYRAKVARVLYNRLKDDMPLGLDSTVVYAENLKTNTTTPKDRKSKSPYNTYKVKGLPPGPISAPGKASLEAAANPEKGDWLYFVTVNFDTGETKFVKTYPEFLEIRDEFQQWCKTTKKCDS